MFPALPAHPPRLLVALLLCLGLSGCGDSLTPLGDPGCPGTSHKATGQVFAVLAYDGGVDGGGDSYAFSRDGTLASSDRTGKTTTSTLSGGAAAAARLEADLRATGVMTLAPGCYGLSEGVIDAQVISATLATPAGAELYLASQDGNGPDELEAAIALLRQAAGR